jgi:hypothetical protein
MRQVMRRCESPCIIMCVRVKMDGCQRHGGQDGRKESKRDVEERFDGSVGCRNGVRMHVLYVSTYGWTNLYVVVVL